MSPDTVSWCCPGCGRFKYCEIIPAGSNEDFPNHDCCASCGYPACLRINNADGSQDVIEDYERIDEILESMEGKPKEGWMA